MVELQINRTTPPFVVSLVKLAIIFILCLLCSYMPYIIVILNKVLKLSCFWQNSKPAILMKHIANCIHQCKGEINKLLNCRLRSCTNSVMASIRQKRYEEINFPEHSYGLEGEPALKQHQDKSAVDTSWILKVIDLFFLNHNITMSLCS